MRIYVVLDSIEGPPILGPNPHPRVAIALIEKCERQKDPKCVMLKLAKIKKRAQNAGTRLSQMVGKA